MKTKIVLPHAIFLLIFFLSCFTGHTTFCYEIITGVIECPAAIKNPPAFPIYTCGKKLNSQQYEINKNIINFLIPLNSKDQMIYIVITKEVQFERANAVADDTSQNTIIYLKVPLNQTYKAYQMILADDAQRETDSSTKNKKQNNKKWFIQQVALPATHRIPDTAIIICCDPDWIEGVAGGNSFALPTITLKSNMLDGMDIEQFNDQSTELILGSIDLNTIHSSHKQTVKMARNITLVAPTT
jgi:hypothetical protein